MTSNGRHQGLTMVVLWASPPEVEKARDAAAAAAAFVISATVPLGLPSRQ